VGRESLKFICKNISEESVTVQNSVISQFCHTLASLAYSDDDGDCDFWALVYIKKSHKAVTLLSIVLRDFV